VALYAMYGCSMGGVCEQDKWAYIAEIASEQGWGMCGISQDHE